MSRRHTLFLLLVLLLGLGGLAVAWVRVDRAIAGLPPSSLVRDALQRRAPPLAAPLAWLLPAAPPLDARALLGWRPAPLAPLDKVSLPVRNTEELRQALARAQAGDVIEMQAGDYPSQTALETVGAGLPQAPIVLRALPGARLLVDGPLALRLSRPWWVIEGLQIEGRCAGTCATALELRGGARHAHLQQLQIRQFGTAIRAQGDNGEWPDHGELLDSLISLDAPAAGGGATALDLVGASQWRVAGNRVIGAARRDDISYAMRLRAGGEGNRIERNLIVCAPHAGFGGQQLGIAVGGDTLPSRRRGDVEQRRAQLLHNLVLNCSDAAVDVQRGVDTELRHNSLLASGGILLRGAGSSAELIANLSSGAWYPRRGTVLGGGRNRRWVPQSTELLAALAEARERLPAAQPGEAPVGADTSWLQP